MNKIKNILLIDDDDIVNLINTMVIKLNDQDIEVRSAINGSVALSMLKESIVNESDHFPDLIFLDINMNILVYYYPRILFHQAIFYLIYYY